jgi:dipeptidyl aminopeptidase/acylaminoacyl peptidase
MKLHVLPHAATALVVLLASHAAPAQTASGYLEPSPEMRAVLDAKPLPSPSLSPDGRTLALVETRRYRRIADLARPVLRLAGRRIDTAASGPQLVAHIESLRLRDVEAQDGREREVKLPPGGDFHHFRWSPDGRRFLLDRRTAQGTELWCGDVAQGSARVIPGVRLNSVLDDGAAWLGADDVVVLTLPDGRGPEPKFDAPSGPAVQESMGRKSPERTLQDLLKNSQDEALFAYHASSVLRRVTLSSGATRLLGEPGLFASVQTLGTQGLLLTQRLVPPFSYQVTWEDFGRAVELRDAQGTVVKTLGAIRLKQGVPVEGVVTGPREYWPSPLADGAVVWVEALDGGDPRQKVPHRDRVLRLDPPYTGAPREVHRTAGRLWQLEFIEGSAQPQRALVTDFERDRLWITSDVIALDGSAPALRLQGRSVRDAYRDPGRPLARVLPGGGSVLRVEGGSLWLIGQGASAQGDQPFLDRWSLADAKPTRVFQSLDPVVFERPLAVLEGGRMLSTRESFAEPPAVALRSGPGLEQMRVLASQPDPTPQLRAIRRELVRFKRADGVELSFWLYLPPDYKPGQRRPTFVWAYPLEFTDGDTAGQVSGSTRRYNTFGGSNPLMLLLDGYVVLMDATMPVVGDPKTVNDSFVEQITANAQAIIDKAVALGVSDAREMVVGGHSYGAFMTANLLAHTHLFKAGIARSGAYNRSLTPFGFQSERRTYWEAQDVYQKLSPFNYADKITEPLLLIHGENDDNPGTFPIQSARFYQALAGTGGQVRYVTLPLEAHGYSARESIGHTLREMSDWMKRQTRDPRAAP